MGPNAPADVHAFGNVFDLVVTRTAEGLQVDAVRGGRTVSSQRIAAGATVRIVF